MPRVKLRVEVYSPSKYRAWLCALSGHALPGLSLTTKPVATTSQNEGFVPGQKGAGVARRITWGEVDGSSFMLLSLLFELAPSFSRQQQERDQRVERTAQDQNSIDGRFTIFVWVGKHRDAPPQETKKDGKEKHRAHKLLCRHCVVLFSYCCKCFVQFSFHTSASPKSRFFFGINRTGCYINPILSQPVSM